jgi:hypothetical protein
VRRSQLRLPRASVGRFELQTGSKRYWLVGLAVAEDELSWEPVTSDVFDASDRFNLQLSTFVFQLTLTLPVTYGNSR